MPQVQTGCLTTLKTFLNLEVNEKQSIEGSFILIYSRKFVKSKILPH